MKPHLLSLSPEEQIVTIMNRIYYGGMTTFSGGNLSIRDDAGTMWITPAGTDKGKLSAADVMCVQVDGTVSGKHRPSSELPFHRAIYKKRPDLRAIVHAHPPALITFSLVREIPETRILTLYQQVCDSVGFAPYAMTGSEALGDNISATFAKGFNLVMLENHGVVTAGVDMLSAFQRFETLEFCANTLIKTKTVGKVQVLESKKSLQKVDFPAFNHAEKSQHESDIRQQVVDILHRAVDRRLMFSASGVVSARVDENAFVMTPAASDNYTLQADDLVLIRCGQVESGKIPHEDTVYHQAIYEANPELQSIMTAHPPHIMAYAVTDAQFETHTIPESYIMLVDQPKLPYGITPTDLAQRISNKQPVVLIQNEGLFVSGDSILKAYDRLEVAEFSAKSLIDTHAVGQLKPISTADILALKEKFDL